MIFFVYMDNVYIGKGKLAGKGVYASRDFAAGEVVKYYHLQKLTQQQFDSLPTLERMFVHSFWGEMYLFPEPSRYTNHSANPNTTSDLKNMCDIALRPIKKGEMITTNATEEVRKELQTFVEVYEKGKDIADFQNISGGYRNAVVSYTADNTRKLLTMKRIDGNWRVLNEKKV